MNAASFAATVWSLQMPIQSPSCETCSPAETVLMNKDGGALSNLDICPAGANSRSSVGVDSTSARARPSASSLIASCLYATIPRVSDQAARIGS